MSRSFASVLSLLALSAVAGCAGSPRSSAVPCSLAAQVPTEQVAEAPPSDFEMEFAPKELSGPRRFTKDGELTGSLHAASPTRTTSE